MYKLNFMNDPKNSLLKTIVKGNKKAEGRVLSDYIKSFKIGEELLLQASQEFVVCEISYLNFYKSFEEMLNTEGFKNMIPFAQCFDEALRVYKSFPGANRVKVNGCCAIGIKYLRGKLLE